MHNPRCLHYAMLIYIHKIHQYTPPIRCIHKFILSIHLHMHISLIIIHVCIPSTNFAHAIHTCQVIHQNSSHSPLCHHSTKAYMHAHYAPPMHLPYTHKILFDANIILLFFYAFCSCILFSPVGVV